MYTSSKLNNEKCIASKKHNTAACIHPNTSFKNLQYTRMGGGGRGNCQQPALYTYVTWPLFAYFCLALSLSC